ncbi:MAG: HAMP domain-containing histidine kinase [Flavobacteriaceae bacterium]|nr:HAMP domain-containing histidine kinase [Flavobacteriaceae bacterium]
MLDKKVFMQRFHLRSVSMLLSVFMITTSTSQDTQNKEIESLYDLAYSQMESDNYYESLQTIYKIHDIATEKNLDKYKAYANHLMGLSYLQHYAYEKAETYFLKAMVSFKARNDFWGQATTYPNLMHLYVLAKDYDKYNTHINQAKAIEKKVNDYNRFYYYETEMIRLYDLKKYDSLVYVSKKALHDIKSGNYSLGGYLDEAQRAAYKYRLEITYELFLAYGLTEKNIEKSSAYKLLNKLEKVNLEDVLWYSARVFEHSSRVRQYKELYHLRQQRINKDSVLYYKNSAAKFTEKAHILLKEKSAENNQYIIGTISKEEEIERTQIISKNQASENALIKKGNYLFVALSVITFFFVVYFYTSSKKLDHTNKDLKKLQADSNKFLGVVSYEIRTPLYALQHLVTKIISERKPEYKEEIGHINHSIINLRHAIDNSLQFSRLNYFSPNMDVYNRPVNLLQLIKNVRFYFRNVLELNQCEMEIRHALQNEKFFLNETKLNIVFKNILKNAIEAPDVSQVVFEMEEHILSKDTSKIVFKIRDNGHGIQQKTLVDIEQKRVLLQNENQHKGIRLGLILCNQILSLYKTQLSFDKTKDQHKVSFSLVLQSIASNTVQNANEV